MDLHLSVDDPTPERWSANTRGLVALTVADHAVTGVHLGFVACTCGWEPNPDEPTGAELPLSDWLQWAAHNADAILTALADEGLLREASDG